MIADLARRSARIATRVEVPAQSLLLLAIRVCWGWRFFQTGLGKLRGIEQTTAYFAQLGIPLPGLNATMAGTTECLGGLFLLLGLSSRLASVPLIFTMCVAYLTAEFPALRGIFSDPDAFFASAPFLFLFAALLVLVFGPGRFSIDHWIGSRIASRVAMQSPSASPI